MKKSSPSFNLQQRITELELLERKQIALLKKSAEALADSISPARVIKSTLSDMVTSPGLKGKLIDTAVGIGAGLIGKKIVTRNSKNVITKITGSVMQFLLSNFISKKMHQVREEVTTG